MADSIPNRKKRFKVLLNGDIKGTTVRVIDENLRQLGVMTLTKVLDLARSRSLDLVEIARTANPPICRIIDYGKFLRDFAKKRK